MKQVFTFASGVDSQAAYDRAKMALMAAYPDRPLPPLFQSAAYDPNVFKAIRDTSKERLDRIESDRKSQVLELRRKEDQKREDFRTDLQQREYERKVARDAQQAKHGGKNAKAVGDPSPALIGLAESVIGQDSSIGPLTPDVPLGTSGKRLTSQAAFSIAARAKAITIENQGIDPPTAVARAFKEAKENGDFKTETSEPTILQRIRGQAGDSKTTYSKSDGGGGGALPASKADLVVGKPYTQGGKTMIWTGKGWKKPDAAAPSGKAATATTSDYGDDEE